jgi:hypothetical protein
MTPDEFRELALSMPGAVERSHMNHPDFRANDRIFASIMPGEKRGTVKLTPEEQRAFMRQARSVFSPAAGAWGRQGWTHVEFVSADTASVRGALTLAWQSVAEKRRPRAAKPRAKKATVRTSRPRTRR